MKNVFVIFLLGLIVSSCSEDEIQTEAPQFTDAERTVSILLRNVPEGHERDNVYVFTLNSNNEIYAVTGATAIEDSLVNIVPTPGNGIFKVVAFIPTVDEWTTKDPFTQGFYSAISAANDRNGTYVITTWEEAENLEGTTQSGISTRIDVVLAINNQNNPVDASYFPGEILQLTADVYDNIDASISSVTFLIDGEEFEVVNQRPYSINYNTINLEAGDHTVSVVAENGEGDTAEDEIEFEIFEGENVAPSVDITNIFNGAQYERQTLISINANASDPDDGIEKVEFVIDGNLVYTDDTAPYNYVWDTYDNQEGQVSIEVIAYDKSGANRSDFVNVSLVNPENFLPRISITSPNEGTIYSSGANIVVNTSVSDPENDPINRVEFYVGNIFKGAVYASPYTFTISTFGLSTGEHVIRAYVYSGNGGSLYTYDEVTITIE